MHTGCLYNVKNYYFKDKLIIYGGLADYNTSIDELLILDLG